MVRVKIAFYKGRSRLFNRLTAWWTRGPYSHCELIQAGRDKGMSCCLSSSFMDGGVRRTLIKLKPENWDVIEVDMPVEQYEAAIVWFALHHGQGYDLLGLFGFVWRPFAGSKSKWFCSEALAAALGFSDAWRFCPNTLYAALKRPAMTSLSAGEA